ncbi:MAG: cysteine hydrolase [Lachnospiraceae bacterium]|nr:cysteine hydrolase [Lachnospiraceae bacterium]
MDVLVVVDMQNDFIDGALGTKEAQAIVPGVAEKINGFSGEVYYTMDTHEADYLSTQEGKNLPVEHCIKGSKGWEIAPEIPVINKANVLEKPTFGSVSLATMLKEKEAELDSVTLIGLCTDICVISNAMLIKAYMPEVPVFVDASCCAGVTPKSHTNALEAMKMCQIQVLS